MFSKMMIDGAALKAFARLVFAVVSVFVAMGVALVVAEPSLASVTLKSPTGSANAEKAGSKVTVTGVATSPGSVVIERSIAPYDRGWQPIKTLEVNAGQRFSFVSREPLNTKYRAVLTPSAGTTEETSKVVGVWRRWPQDKIRYRKFPFGFNARISQTFPQAALAPGNPFGLDGARVRVWVRWTKPRSWRKPYYVLKTSTLTSFSGSTLVFSFDISRPERVRWYAMFVACVDTKGAPDAFGSPASNGWGCPSKKRLSLDYVRRWVAETKDG